MKRFSVLFSIGQKKMKMTVEAENSIIAAHIVKEKLYIHKVVEDRIDTAEDAPKDDVFDKIMDMLDQTIDTLKSKTKKPS